MSAQKSQPWLPETRPPALEAAEVHVWRTSLDRAEDELLHLRGYLCPSELARSDRFIRPELRSRFTVARGTLRLLLAGYLGVQPEDIEFEVDDHGKPSIAGAASPLFNISHSADHALFAFARDLDVGIDLEATRRRSASWPIAERFFAPEELASLRELDPDEFEAGFFRVWTRKEAYLKGVGSGITRPLDSFAVSVDDLKPALLHDHLSPLARESWRLVALEPGRGLVGTLAVRAERFEVRQYDAGGLTGSTRPPGD